MENVHAVFNGTFDNLENIKISPLSRAYTFSDSVYEVIPFHNAKAIAFDRHIKRLQKSLIVKTMIYILILPNVTTI